jgi:hypothetical protein
MAFVLAVALPVFLPDEKRRRQISLAVISLYTVIFFSRPISEAKYYLIPSKNAFCFFNNCFF